jgi:hypothetical protein
LAYRAANNVVGIDRELNFPQLIFNYSTNATNKLKREHVPSPSVPRANHVSGAIVAANIIVPLAL